MKTSEISRCKIELGEFRQQLQTNTDTFKQRLNEAVLSEQKSLKKIVAYEQEITKLKNDLKIVTEKLEAKTAHLNSMKSQYETNLRDTATEYDQTKAELTQVNQKLQMKIEEVVELTGILLFFYKSFYYNLKLIFIL